MFAWLWQLFDPNIVFVQCQRNTLALRESKSLFPRRPVGDYTQTREQRSGVVGRHSFKDSFPEFNRLPGAQKGEDRIRLFSKDAVTHYCISCCGSGPEYGASRYASRIQRAPLSSISAWIGLARLKSVFRVLPGAAYREIGGALFV